jgi:adenine/guanine/hypoxanthine permease
MPSAKNVNHSRYKWAALGDVNAFFGLMLDNIAGLVLAVSLLANSFQFPEEFALRYMVPGTAIGVLVGDLMFFALAFVLAKRTGRNDVTAMPLGLDTPSTIGMVLFVIGPAYESARQSMDPEQSAIYAWHIGICAVIMTGLIKMVFSFGANWLRHAFPRAGLLGSLAAIALVLIAFVPLLEIAATPIVGFISLAIILTTLVARVKLPFKVPGAAIAVVAGCVIYYVLKGIGHVAEIELVPPNSTAINETAGLFPYEWFTVFQFEWISRFDEALNYLPYIIPFAITTVVGGIDCTESAASVGDDFDTKSVIGVEAIATVLAGLCGGVVQTTPYIGHPAYKAMGGRAAYTLATALFVGAAGVFGFFGFLYFYIPKAAIYSILIFIGIEITAQSFWATPKRHYAAIAAACLFATAKLVDIYVGQIAWLLSLSAENISYLKTNLDTISLLAGGFILTSLFWASALAKMIDRKFIAASTFFAVSGICTLFGFIHSPYQMHFDQPQGERPGEKIFIPFDLPGASEDVNRFVLKPEFRQTVFTFAGAYLTVAVFCFVFGIVNRRNLKPIETDEEFFEEH